MMPFLHDGDPSVTITPTNGNGKPEFVKAKQVGNSTSKMATPGQSSVVVKTSASPLSLAEIQRKAAQRKLQMAKLIGHGGLSSGMDVYRKGQGHQSMMVMGDYHDSMQAQAAAAARRARSNNFTLNETFALLKVWASPEMQWQMKHNFRNFRCWEAIACAMNELGYDRTAIQCKNRIQNLTSIFYRIKKSKQDYRTFNFPYYKIIQDVLDSKKNSTNSQIPPPNMAEFLQRFQNSSSNVMTNDSSSGGAGSSGLAAHMALVEEYQHLINGNPEVTLTPTLDRSSNGTSGMNVLSPEVSISEGDSPLRMDSVRAGTSGSPSADRNVNGISSGMKSEHDDGMMGEDGSGPSENDQEGDYDDGTMYSTEDDLGMLGGLDGFTPSVRNKRSFSSNFGMFGKSGYNGIPSKRPRGHSSATTTSGTAEDPIGQYLSEMVEIERQWLDMERERAENERQMMIYMMQILQALVCPEQEQEQEEGAEDGNDQDPEAAEHEFGDGDGDNDETEAHHAEMTQQDEDSSEQQ